jgi:hypothetical protein
VVLGELAGAQREHGGRERDQRRIRLRSWAPPSEAAAATPITVGLSNGSFAAGIAFLTSGITANASPSRTTPRTPGTPSTPLTRGLRPEATRISPCLSRTAAAQWVGPCTSRPLRRAIPPRRSLPSVTGLKGEAS